jgi:hypothetical protein
MNAQKKTYLNDSTIPDHALASDEARGTLNVFHVRDLFMQNGDRKPIEDINTDRDAIPTSTDSRKHKHQRPFRTIINQTITAYKFSNITLCLFRHQTTKQTNVSIVHSK